MREREKDRNCNIIISIRACLYTVAGNSATVYKPFNTVGDCTIGLIYSFGGCVTFKYFKFLFATV